MLAAHAIGTQRQTLIADFRGVGDPEVRAVLGHDEVWRAHAFGEDATILLGFQQARPLGQGERVEEFAVGRLRDVALDVLFQRQRTERLGDGGFVDDFHRDAGGGSVGGTEGDFDWSTEFLDLLLDAAGGAEGDTQRHKIPDSRAHQHYIEQRMCQRGRLEGFL